MTPDITAQNTEIVFRTKHHPMVCQQEIPTVKVSANLVRSMEAAENLSQILTDLKFSCRTVISLRCLKWLALDQLKFDLFNQTVQSITGPLTGMVLALIVVTVGTVYTMW